MKLVHHVCGETDGLQSLFLITRSNCAFANFGDEAARVTAQQKVHDSRFQAVRLVSRLRMDDVEGAPDASLHTGPATPTTTTPASGTTSTSESNPTATEPSNLPSSTAPVLDPKPPRAGRPNEAIANADRYFILKSLTVDDLETSRRTGNWATQTHNEEILNQAFRTADNVFLIFSANKSGEYFGYARMLSELNQDPGAAIEFAPRTHSRSKVDMPQALVVEAIDKVPRGTIIHDRFRETVFWEADRDNAEGSSENSGSGGGNDPELEDQAWGKPFRVEWMSTTRLPFHRTRGIRNSWNSNREVKIARDGTELDPSAGRRLINLFDRGQTTSMPSPIGLPPGYSHMESFGR